MPDGTSALFKASSSRSNSASRAIIFCSRHSWESAVQEWNRSPPRSLARRHAIPEQSGKGPRPQLDCRHPTSEYDLRMEPGTLDTRCDSSDSPHSASLLEMWRKKYRKVWGLYLLPPGAFIAPQLRAPVAGPVRFSRMAFPASGPSRRDVPPAAGSGGRERNRLRGACPTRYSKTMGRLPAAWNGRRRAGGTDV